MNESTMEIQEYTAQSEIVKIDDSMYMRLEYSDLYEPIWLAVASLSLNKLTSAANARLEAQYQTSQPLPLVPWSIADDDRPLVTM
jgi:hypothetical protein